MLTWAHLKSALVGNLLYLDNTWRGMVVGYNQSRQGHAWVRNFIIPVNIALTENLKL